MNSIHDNQKVIDDEKKTQKERAEKAEKAETLISETITPEQVASGKSTEDAGNALAGDDQKIELNAGNELIGKPNFEKKCEQEKIEEQQAEKDAYIKKLEEENASLKHDVQDYALKILEQKKSEAPIAEEQKSDEQS